MKRHIKAGTLTVIFSFVVLMLSFFPASSNASIYEYDYRGNHFTNVVAPYTTDYFITIRIISDQPLTGTYYNDVGPNPVLFRYMVSDGIASSPWINAPSFYGAVMVVGADGLPEHWSLGTNQFLDAEIRSEHAESGDRIISRDKASTIVSSDPLIVAHGYVDNDPGVWTVTVSGEPVPEPSTLVLVGVGLAGTACVIFRKRRSQTA